jgi:hypothetical protein
MISNLRSRLNMYPGTCAHDATGLGTVVKDLIDSKVPITDVVLSGSARSALFNEYIAAIEARAFVSPLVEFCYSEHKYLTFDDLYGKGHPPDSFVAASLCWSQRKQGIPAVAPTTEGLVGPGGKWNV